MLVLELALCTECGACVPICPVDALRLAVGGLLIDQAICDDCAICVALCPTGALLLPKEAHEQV